MDGCVGAINTFVVEPFVPHKQEYYMCIQVGSLQSHTRQHQIHPLGARSNKEISLTTLHCACNQGM